MSIYVLGIESSCDETSAAVVKGGREVLSNVIYSQIDIHKKYGGVVPEIASRDHTAKIAGVVSEALENANMSINDVSVVTATCGPGLVGALLVGLSFGKALAFSANKPFVGVHHIEGHLSSVYLESEMKPPFVCLVASGGHTNLIYVSDFGKYEILGRTRDDAAGEAFDKIARAIGLPYPGGAEIERLAKTGDANAIPLPRAIKAGLDFSFSGLKSAALNFMNKQKMNGESFKNEDMAAALQFSITETLTEKAISACKLKKCGRLAFSGGVASNETIRARLAEVCALNGIEFYAPERKYCTDNAAMIASCGYFSYINGKTSGLDLNANPNLPISEAVNV